MFFWAQGPGILIWNWHTGALLVNLVHNSVYQNALPPVPWDFAFISTRAFLVTSVAGPGSIELYSFRGDQPLDMTSKTFGSLRRVASLGMPPIKPSQDLSAFSTHAGPFVHKPGAGKPFITSREACTHLFELHYGERRPHFLLFVPNRFFLSLIPPEDDPRFPGHPLERPWDTWGPANSRALRHRSPFQWLRYIHGHRFVFPPPPTGLFHTDWPLVVLDFNVHTKRANDPVEKPDNYKEITAPEGLRDEEVFQEDVVTCLPYSRSVKAGNFEYSGLMIDDERLIGMKSMAFAHGDMTDIDVFTF